MKKEGGKKTLAIKIIFFFLIAWAIYLMIASYPFRDIDSTEKILKKDPSIGRILNFNLPLAYTSDCMVCGTDSKRSTEINRNLECIEDINSIGPYYFKDNFYNVKYVPSNTTFEVMETIKIAHRGIRRGFAGEGYELVVLKDEKGTTSTMLLNFIEDERGPCINKMTPHLEKLFRFIEDNGKARIIATVYEIKSDKSDGVTRRIMVSDEATQQFTLNALASAPSKYNFSNLELVSSNIPGMLGVAVNVDADSLVYLIASYSDFKVWEITSLDSEYQNSLTSDDISKMRSAPEYLR